MAKLILTTGDTKLQELALNKGRITIGRAPHNDIIISDLAVSAEHAAIVTIQNDSFLEDLNSTNGTQINGQPVKKHFLQNNDAIEIAQYKIRYLTNHECLNQCEEGYALSPRDSCGAAKIRVLDGAHAGKETAVTKVLTTIGQPGVQVAVLSRRTDGYYLTHLEGTTYPTINGNAINENPYLVKDGDEIAVAGVRMQFLVE